MTVAATASDDVGVVGVQFLLDGVPLGAEDTTAPYEAGVDTATVGERRAHADGGRARCGGPSDDGGERQRDGGERHDGADGDGDESGRGEQCERTVTVRATASDDVGVVGVQFLLDGAPLGAEDTTAPYEVAWDTATSRTARTR